MENTWVKWLLRAQYDIHLGVASVATIRFAGRA